MSLGIFYYLTPMTTRVCASFLVVFSALVECRGQGTTQFHINFDGQPPQPPGTSVFIQQYSESGMWFRPIGALGPGKGFSHRRGGGSLSPAPDNGTTYLAAALGDSLLFSFTNGSLFGLSSVDLAEYSTVVPDATTVHFVGYHKDGSTVIADLTTDGIIDGSGPLADFQTFNFGPEFSGLTRVEIPTYGWSLDNLIVSVPEPTSVSLVLLGGFVLWGLRPCRRVGKRG